MWLKAKSHLLKDLTFTGKLYFCAVWQVISTDCTKKYLGHYETSMLGLFKNTP